jgi:hypothetical protein
MAEGDIKVLRENFEGVYEEIALEVTDIEVSNLNNLPTSDEKAALIGTGTPSSENKYVTNDTLTTSLGDIQIILESI